MFSRIATYRNLLPRSNVVKIVVNVVKFFKGKPGDLCHSVYRLGNFQFTLQTLGFLLLEFFWFLILITLNYSMFKIKNHDAYIIMKIYKESYIKEKES